MIDPRDSDSPFGVLDFLPWNHEWNQWHYPPEKVEKSLGLMNEAGVAFIRMDFLWNELEPQPEQFDFAKYDDLVERITRHGIKILGLLLYGPTWEGRPWNRAPEPALYARYARRVIARYKDRIRHWEIWNEPDHVTFWDPQDNLYSYVQLLKYVYPLLKNEDPSCLIHLAGTSKGLPASIRHFYTHGARDFFDVLHVHPYTNPLVPEAIDGMKALYGHARRVMQEFGDEQKPVWFSELGCPGLSDPSSQAPWWFGKNPTEKDQAGWLKQVYQKALKWEGVQRIFWAFFRDTESHWKTGEDHMGLIRSDFSKKPAFEVYHGLSHSLSLPSPVGPINS